MMLGAPFRECRSFNFTLILCRATLILAPLMMLGAPFREFHADSLQNDSDFGTTDDVGGSVSGVPADDVGGSVSGVPAPEFQADSLQNDSDFGTTDDVGGSVFMQHLMVSFGTNTTEIRLPKFWNPKLTTSVPKTTNSNRRNRRREITKPARCGHLGFTTTESEKKHNIESPRESCFSWFRYASAKSIQIIMN